MFSLAFLIGIYSYLIFSLGLLGILYKGNVAFLTVVYFFFSVYLLRKEISKITIRLSLNLPLVLVILLAFVNLIGALGPELGFDALWYHLTLPKIYLINHQISHITGGLLYYSDMPKLIEMIYVGALSLGGEILAKLIHFTFGILCLVAIYKISRKFFDKDLSLLVCLIFYSSLVVDWMSITAYIDLGRTFFELMALWGFINFFETNKKSWLLESSFMLGLAVSSKLLAIGSILIFIILLIIFIKKFNKRFLLYFLFMPVLVASPWFVSSLLNTGNPIYPFFSDIYKTGLSISLLNPVNFIGEIFNIFIKSSDPLNPLFIILVPTLFFNLRRMNRRLKVILVYSIAAIIVWYFTPRTGGGRFMLPYTPAFSILSVEAYRELSEIKFLSRFIYLSIILVAVISIIYRGVANSKYVPYLVGKETKSQFLSHNLNYKFGDFYDTDGFFAKTIRSDDRVLLYGFHNLYYIDFPFIDSSYVKVGDKYNFIATQNYQIPNRFKFWKEIYSNPETGVKLYTYQGRMWFY